MSRRGVILDIAHADRPALLPTLGGERHRVHGAKRSSIAVTQIPAPGQDAAAGEGRQVDSQLLQRSPDAELTELGVRLASPNQRHGLEVELEGWPVRRSRAILHPSRPSIFQRGRRRGGCIGRGSASSAFLTARSKRPRQIAAISRSLGGDHSASSLTMASRVPSDRTRRYVVTRRAPLRVLRLRRKPDADYRRAARRRFKATTNSASAPTSVAISGSGEPPSD